ncbi:phosphoribosylamine--glycine ligase (plasmid) [Pantoea agglomerans]|uniref:phosphoribosylamine--glycine ligase n=1 Tax=Enterobacter agglomerans TaxID=549 RepID=UPI00177B1501|nr:phosphoribosylamine--glycine ligase [Pantoea agglomerans]WLO87371.1 phosphoribosylamine--glycine ligase [Pantoea agglomerans]WVJ49096.1 phosphoribosylamine--glycine ligase [Pantoea agglomerans]
MKILVSGSGAGAQALAWKLLQSDCVDRVYLAPGNPATEMDSRMENIPVKSSDIIGLAKAASELDVDYTLITPTQTLASGVADHFNNLGLPIVAPTKDASKLEWSKVYSKSFMKRHNIPTPKSMICRDKNEIIAFSSSFSFPFVLKADGMVHGGTGVIIVSDEDEFNQAIDLIIASEESKVIIEEFILGDEVSYTIIYDGENYVPLAESRDYKKLLNGNIGPNTGGMGAYSPVLSEKQHLVIRHDIIDPFIDALKKDEINYLGFLYFGIITDKNGKPYLLEVNCRLGNPEIFTILERLESSLNDVFLATLNKNLKNLKLTWSKKVSVALQISSEGYPFVEKTGDLISLPHDSDEAHIFHSSVISKNGQLISNGGRVIAISTTGSDFDDARKKLYNVTNQVKFDGMHYRTDIAENI